MTPRKTLFTPSHAPVDLALLAPGRMTRKNYLYGGTLTLYDTWLASVKGWDTEEWVGETVFDIEVCARVPAQSMYVQGSACTYSGDLDPSHASPAFQAEENVVCNFNFGGRYVCRWAFMWDLHPKSLSCVRLTQVLPPWFQHIAFF